MTQLYSAVRVSVLLRLVDVNLGRAVTGHELEVELGLIGVTSRRVSSTHPRSSIDLAERFQTGRSRRLKIMRSRGLRPARRRRDRCTHKHPHWTCASSSGATSSSVPVVSFGATLTRNRVLATVHAPIIRATRCLGSWKTALPRPCTHASLARLPRKAGVRRRDEYTMHR